MINAIDFLTAQHRDVQRLFASYETGSSKVKRRTLFEKIENNLVRHAVIEELHLYPLIRARSGNGIKLAAHAHEEHAEIENCLKRLDSLDPDSLLFDTEMRKLIKVVLRHVRSEEQIPGLFSILRREYEAAELDALGDKLERSDEACSYALSSLRTESPPILANPEHRGGSPVSKIAGRMMAAIGSARNTVIGRGRQP